METMGGKDDERHKEFLILALTAAARRAKLMEADINTIGFALKSGLIGPDVAVRWIVEAGLLWMVGSLPESTTKLTGNGK